MHIKEKAEPTTTDGPLNRNKPQLQRAAASQTPIQSPLPSSRRDLSIRTFHAEVPAVGSSPPATQSSMSALRSTT